MAIQANFITLIQQTNKQTNTFTFPVNLYSNKKKFNIQIKLTGKSSKIRIQGEKIKQLFN